MGRPLNKKYFGGRNAGITGGYNRSVDSTSGLAGTSVNAPGVTVTTVGSYTTAFPALTFATPLGGEGITTATATGTFVGKVISATVAGGNSGTKAYQTGQVLSTRGGATLTVATIANSLGDTIASTNGSNQVVFSNTTAYIPGMDFLTSASLTGSGLTAATRYWIVSGSGTTYSVASSYANAIAGTALTFGSGAVGSNGSVLVGTQAGPIATLTVTTGGSVTSGSTGAQATTNTTTPGGTGATVVLTYGLSGVTVTDTGAGYAPSQAPVAITASSGSAAATITLEAEVTSGYSVALDYPSIVAYAITTGTTSRRYSDIVKQEGSRSFRVVNTDSKTYPGTFCKLITATPTVAGTMAINATDSDGNTYWVEKLSNRKATIVSGGVGTPGTQFTTPTQVPWTFGSAVANVSVKIDNI